MKINPEEKYFFGDELETYENKDLKRMKEIEEKKESEMSNQKSESSLILDPSSSYIQTGDTKLKTNFEALSDIKLGIFSDVQPPISLDLGSMKYASIDDEWAYFIFNAGYGSETFAVNKNDCWWDNKYIVVPDIEYDWIETEESRKLESDISKIDNEYLKDIIEGSLSYEAYKKQIKIFKGLNSYLLNFCEFYLGSYCNIGTKSPKTKLEVKGGI